MEEYEPVQPRDPNDPTLGATSVPHLPPSNLEIKIRTMASDVESVGKGGGLLGIAEKISISIPQGRNAPENPISQAGGPAVSEAVPRKNILKYVLFGVGGALVLFAAGYFLPTLLSGSGKSGTVGGGAIATTTQKENSTPPPTAQSAKLEHKSFFAVSPDAILPFLPTSATGLSVREQWFEAFKFATGTITETQFGNAAGEYLSFPDFLSALNVNFSAVNILREDFERDFTSFVYRDAAGLWPGYVLKLKSGINALLVRGDIAKFEAEADFINSTFAAVPGARDIAFKDAQISGIPVRELSFVSKPAMFVYGFGNQGYLILATSEDAFKSALSRL